MELAHRLGIPPRCVQVWFQNRRQKWKSVHNVGIDGRRSLHGGGHLLNLGSGDIMDQQQRDNDLMIASMAPMSAEHRSRYEHQLGPMRMHGGMPGLAQPRYDGMSHAHVRPLDAHGAYQLGARQAAMPQLVSRQPMQPQPMMMHHLAGGPGGPWESSQHQVQRPQPYHQSYGGMDAPGIQMPSHHSGYTLGGAGQALAPMQDQDVPPGLGNPIQVYQHADGSLWHAGPNGYTKYCRAPPSEQPSMHAAPPPAPPAPPPQAPPPLCRRRRPMVRPPALAHPPRRRC